METSLLEAELTAQQVKVVKMIFFFLFS